MLHSVEAVQFAGNSVVQIVQFFDKSLSGLRSDRSRYSASSCSFLTHAAPRSPFGEVAPSVACASRRVRTWHFCLWPCRVTIRVQVPVVPLLRSVAFGPVPWTTRLV
ncbi:hypothetical protein EVAR_66551_1 [Eumeta japonica]|uniref:Uncharacterized protein n=1 Tax=Eumeta variegata TaxID=151549 RepID=A0A4C1ZHK9_EUMVA|nr:hypothetical protein EVAR_66551_1 [Eumeta japonica]